VTTPSVIYGQFGQALAFAERTLTAALRDQLAQRGTKPETWYALQLVATTSPAINRQTLTDILAGSRNLDAISASALVEQLETDSLLRGDTHIELTAEGQTLHRSLREYLGAPTALLLSQFDINDIETTVRTLQAITERAAQ
jgi:DNA-binding MarR family transcriptional regulator